LACHLQNDANPDPAHHFDADADPKTTFQFGADPCESGSGTLPDLDTDQLSTTERHILTSFPSSMTDFISVPRALPENKDNFSRVSDPDPDWIRIQSGQWIRIRNPDPDPDPGGQK
jgi:hypothetical protein